MKKFFFLFIFLAVVFVCCFGVKNKSNKAMATAAPDNSSGKAVAVLELFTSQGCSSCPPADRLLGTLSGIPQVIALSFHVDYWDRFGWRDPFSSAAFTQRQMSYATALHSDVYTPQLIVNGQTEMLGSDSNKIVQSIQKILSQDPDASVTIQSAKNENGKAMVNFTIAGSIHKCAANVVIVEKQATTAVKAGENTGATITDYNVVRSFVSLNKITVGDNSAGITIPSSVDTKDLSVVVFLQQKDNKIVAAARQELQ